MALGISNLQQYYASNGLNHGDYQFITLHDLVTNFMLGYVGEDKIIPKINRVDVKFHAMRGIQELTYDVFRSCKTLELEVPPSLILPLPHDYVEYVKYTWIDSGGNCHVMNHCKACPRDPRSFKQEPETVVDIKGDTVYTEGDINLRKLGPEEEDSETWKRKQTGSNSGQEDLTDHELHYTYSGQRYGLDPKDANANGCFYINCRNGRIYFDSNMVGRTVTLQYISDGVATEEEMIVHKFAEEAMYKHIAHAILNTRAQADPNAIARYKKERFAAVRNAKIRLSSIKLNEMTQILRGKSKWIKH